MQRSSHTRDASLWERWAFARYQRQSDDRVKHLKRPPSQSSPETCYLDGDPWIAIDVPEQLAKRAANYKESSMEDSGFVEPIQPSLAEPKLVELQQTTNQPAMKPAYEGALHLYFGDITYGNMHPGPLHQQGTDLRLELGLIKLYMNEEISMAGSDDHEFHTTLLEELLIDEHEVRNELHTLEHNDLNDLERQLWFGISGLRFDTYSAHHLRYTSEHSCYRSAARTPTFMNRAATQLPPLISGHEPQTAHNRAWEISSATIGRHSSHIREPDSSPSKSSRSEPSTSSQTEMEEAEPYKRVRELSNEVVNLRSDIYALRSRQTNMEQLIDKEEESVLKSVRGAIAASDSRATEVMIPTELLFDVAKVLSRKRDELGSPLNDILRLEQNLALTEFRLRQAEEELHRRYLSTSQMPVNPVHRSPHHSEHDSDDGSEGSTTHRLPAIGGNLPATRGAGEYEADSETTESFQDELQAAKTGEPSRYHPKYVELQNLIGRMKLRQERLFYFEHKQAKLQDRKEQRARTRLRLSEVDSVSVHLSKEDEEELRGLPDKIGKLQEEEFEALKEIDRLREECLMLRIMDEKKIPLENDSWGKDYEKQHQENLGALAALEAWIINPAVANTQRRAPKRMNWSRATYRQQRLSRGLISKTIQKLDSESSIDSKLSTLKLQHRAAIQHFLDHRNRNEPDKDFRWTIAQIEPIFSRGGFRCVTTYLERRRNEFKGSVTVGRSFAQLRQQGAPHDNPRTTEAPPAALSPPSGDIMQALKTNTKEGSHHYGAPDLVVNPASETQQRSPSSVSAQGGLQPPAHPNMAGSQTLALTNIALTANLNAMPGNPHGGLESRVNPWLFGQLENSRSEVRLLATVMQATGVPLLKIPPEKTAGQIMSLWDINGYSSLIHGGGLISEQQFAFAGTAKYLKQEGYDKTFVKQVVGYAFDKENHEPQADAEYGCSGGYEGSLPDF